MKVAKALVSVKFIILPQHCSIDYFTEIFTQALSCFTFTKEIQINIGSSNTDCRQSNEVVIDHHDYSVEACSLTR